jgi:integrase
MSEHQSKRIVVWVQHFADRPFLMLQWYDPDTGKRKSKSAQTCNPLEAEQARADLEYELNNGLYQEGSRISWEKFRELFEAEYLAGLRQKTQIKYGTVLDVFEQTVAPRALRDATERTVSRFVKGLRERRQRKQGKVGLEPVTIHNYLVALKTALGWAVGQKLLPSLPAFPAVRVPRKKPQPIPAESFERLLAKAPDDLWHAYLLCGWYAGLRFTETLSLEWERGDRHPWIDFDRNRVVLPAVFAKSAEDQSVPLHPILRAALEALPRTGQRVFLFPSKRPGRLLTWRAVSWRVKEMAKAAGVRLTMHKLRKGFGCRVAQQLGKGNAPVLHELMRHSSMQITMDYYASVDDVLQDAINQLR